MARPTTMGAPGSINEPGFATRDALECGLAESVTGDAAAMAHFVARAFGQSTLAIIHYGSRAQGRPTRSESAYDFFVVVANYGEAYRALARNVGTSFKPGVAAALARVLGPNVIAIATRNDGVSTTAKCIVLSGEDFQRDCSSRPRDHFTQGRLTQKVLLAWVRDEEGRNLAVEGICNSRRQTFDWVSCYLPARFDVESYCVTLLSTSLSFEIRPEAAGHARRLFEAQRETMLAVYGPLLNELCREGTLRLENGKYVLADAPGGAHRFRVGLYFRRSKLRATLRLIKGVALYDNWLDYVVAKIARSTGETIELSERERKWPMIFIWPKVWHYLRNRPQRRA